MNLIIENPQTALWNGQRLRCAIGRGGTIAADSKREGDGATPIGRWPLRQVFYRPDRVARPQAALPLQAITPADAWCDIDGDPLYNRHIQLPGPTKDERLWRDDHLYDVVVMMGYNDAPVRPGRGSAIFLHVARPDFSPSSGCVTLALPDLLRVLAEAESTSCVDVLSLG